MNEATKIPCRWCGYPTPMLGTKKCDNCWELSGRIRSDPEMAEQMLAALKRGEDI